MLPYWFGALTMGAVNQAAQAVVIEVRRQFQEIPGLLEGTAEADYHKCVTMITGGALHAMVFPVFLVVLSPLIFGIGLGPEFLTGLILGAIVSGFMLGGMMSASGGAWDNAKKLIESPQGKAEFGGKGRSPHKAAVVGDTIGDPFKDTSGPALNILIKLMSYISVVLSPVFKKQADFWWVSLILIGLLIAFIPWWIKMTPEGMRPENVEKITKQLLENEAKEIAAAHGHGNGASNGHATDEHKGGAEGVIASPVHRTFVDASAAPKDAAPLPLPSIELSIVGNGPVVAAAPAPAPAPVVIAIEAAAIPPPA